MTDREREKECERDKERDECNQTERKVDLGVSRFSRIAHQCRHRLEYLQWGGSQILQRWTAETRSRPAARPRLERARPEFCTGHVLYIYHKSRCCTPWRTRFAQMSHQSRHRLEYLVSYFSPEMLFKTMLVFLRKNN